MSSTTTSSLKRGVLYRHPTRRMPLRAYDDFCLLFLGRNGVYYTEMTPAIVNRKLSSGQLTLAFIEYHRALNTKSTTITWTQLQDWFNASQATRNSTFLRSSYPWDSFISLLQSRRPHKPNDYKEYFISLSYYLNIFLSPNIEYTMIPYIDSEMSWGIVAKKELNPNTKLRELRGELVQVTDEEMRLLNEKGLDFSVLGIAGEELDTAAKIEPLEIQDRNEQKQQERRRRKRLLTLQSEGRYVKSRGDTKKAHYHFIVAGPLCFLNHACGFKHANVWPGEENVLLDADEPVTHKQWQVVVIYRKIRRGQEVLVDYFTHTNDPNEYKCYACEAHTRTNK
jgi:hypothetical protein